MAFVSVATSAAGREPWISIDTGAGFTEVSLGDLHPGTASSYPTDFVAAGGVTFFVADTPGAGRELWKTNGSAATTVLVKDIFPGSPSSSILAPVAFDGRLFFGACDAGDRLRALDERRHRRRNAALQRHPAREPQQRSTLPQGRR